MKRKPGKGKAVREDRLMLLSRRESQVVELMGKGLSRPEISDRLGVSRKCVSVFIERARKISLKNVASTRTFSLSNGDFRWQVSLMKCLLLLRFAVAFRADASLSQQRVRKLRFVI